ncbi:monosaccharide ABC transporter ATP-binding protein, CUT2 family [Geodermatophilus amargosae]|uniref:Monosaccharide ABC transporter ATP-binding protein, CUT2 family n=1 Tax=Geodermatophilus amargosae TaxID=1296565 RepID=A0A1I7DFQ3_9ACTN|nr:sugar ABC transporter ATP-binding protein [Geodermatophilus amargosae]SFU10425.1 monosaccharide ABC transporter ATP-binding protein, CUT2 family [Geodermatophilus amargosae]
MTAVASSEREMVLSLRGVTKTFGAQRALDSVDLEIAKGEIHAVVGQNGCGKSTLVKLLGGYHGPDAGSDATVAGEPFELGSAAAANQAGLRFVHQDLGLIEDLSVAENFFMASDRGWVKPISKGDERSRAGRALKDFGYDIDPRARVGSLSAAQRTVVAIVRALHGEKPPALLILDEPTASLPGPDAQLLFDALRRLTQAGGSVLFISHHLDEVMELADTVTVLRDGRKVTTVSSRDLSHDRLVELMLGRALTPRTQADVAAAESDSGEEPRLTVRNMHGGGLRGIDLDVRPGEVVGIAGLTGSGRESIAGAIAGQLHLSGTVAIDGRSVRPGDPAASLARGLAYAPAERRRDALLSTATLRENLTIADIRSISRRGRLSRRLERKDAQKWMKVLDVRPPMSERVIDQFSGGNQQKVVLGRLLRTGPKVLVLDEPTQGVDVGAKATIHDLVVGAASAGAAVIVCSSDVEELVQVSTRVLVFRRGRLGAELTGPHLTVERIEEEQLRPADAAPTSGAAAGAPEEGEVSRG